MEISREEIVHIAKLASLNLTEQEIEKYTNDMKDILNFANTVNNVNTDGIDESITASQSNNVFRKDEVIEFENRDLLLQNAPTQEDGMFRIPKVIG
jgi:aspartyl-tRNA(Asn)/glutamyl-tRNA(Gln) amidotransferase subunit C